MKKRCTIPFFIVNRGCPHKCVFCDQGSITGAGGDRPEDVDERITRYLRTMDPRRQHIQVGFFGGSFTGLPLEEQEAFLKPAKRFVQTGSISSIRLSARPDQIDNTSLEILRDSGVGCIELGVQSADSVVLKSSLRGHTHEDTVRASGLIKDVGFKLAHQLMLGLPGSDLDKELFTAREAVSSGAAEARIYPAVVLKGTRLADMWRSGRYEELTELQAVERAARVGMYLAGKGVKVIRYGLHASESLISGENIYAGPFHPAFGAKVKSRMFGMLLDRLISFETGKAVRLVIHPQEEPLVRGYAKSNLPRLDRLLPERTFSFRRDLAKMHIEAVFRDRTVTVGPKDIASLPEGGTC